MWFSRLEQCDLSRSVHTLCLASFPPEHVLGWLSQASFTASHEFQRRHMTAWVRLWVYGGPVWEGSTVLWLVCPQASQRARSHAVAPSVLQVMNGLMQTTGWPSVVACVGNWFGKGKWVPGCWPSSANAHFLLLRLTSLHVWPHFDSPVWPGFDFCQTTKWQARRHEVFFGLAQKVQQRNTQWCHYIT